MKKNIILLSLLAFTAVSLRAEVKYMTTTDFQSSVMDFTKYTRETGWKYNGKKPCVIDFYTTWCGPCKRLAPIMEELSEQYKNKVSFYKVDTEQERQLAYFFGISSIPQILLIPVEGDPRILQGLQPKEELQKQIDTFLLGKKAK